MRPVEEVLKDCENDMTGLIRMTWAHKPGQFCRDVLRMEPQPWQEEFMQAVSNARFGLPNMPDGTTKMRFSVRSGTGVGKTGSVAALILWHLACFPDSKIPCTAPTSPQIKAVLWPELRKWIQNIPAPIREILPYDAQTDRIMLFENFAVARTAREEMPESFQGFHAKNIMLLADEASGVPDAVYLAGQGVMSSKGAITILIGNPTRAAGWFYDSFHSDAHQYWTKRVGCDQSTLVQPEYITEMRRKHGEDSYEFRVRVMGEFHLEDTGMVIPRSWVEAAIGREIDTDTDHVIWGIDVSAGGKDKSAIAKRRGNELLEPVKSWGGKDIMQFVGITLDEYYRTPEHLKPREICVDVIGVGQGYFSRLKEELRPEIEANRVRVRGINVAERKSVSDRYLSLRVELWGKAREWFEMQTCKIPNDPTLINQLCSVEWEIKDSNGKWALVDKKSGGGSPDEADAFLLTFAGSRGAPPQRGKTFLQNRFANPNQNMYAIGSASYLQGRGA